MSRYEYTYEARNKKFKSWLNQQYDGLSSYADNDEGLFETNEDFVHFLCDKLLAKIGEKSFKITDEKQFKDEIATYIYRNSI
tara:strand:- start:97 stop:342 length:246 start_codon:yes stop_codon:yes gene_type:complete